MTVPVIASNDVQYVEDGATLSFPVPYRFLATSDLEVRRRLPGSVDFQDIVGWSASGAGNANGGAVELANSVAGATLSIRRETSVQQPTAFDPLQDFPAESTELSLDRIAMAVQDLAAAVRLTTQRAFMVPEGETAAELPAAGARAGTVLAFDATGTPILIQPMGVVGDPTAVLAGLLPWTLIDQATGQTVTGFLHLNGGVFTLVPLAA